MKIINNKNLFEAVRSRTAFNEISETEASNLVGGKGKSKCKKMINKLLGDINININIHGKGCN